MFDDSILCAQFLNDYVKGLEHIEIRPEDIEDVSERYVPLVGEERNSDIVKRINIPSKSPFYFITLIEHKTKVDYNVAMQIFRYTYLIWEDYEKEMEKQHKGISKTKDFRYPPVLPIVYYEGKETWTAPLNFRDRISMQEMFGDMIPDFTYQLVQLNDYSNEELLDKGDAISLLMMLGKIKTKEDVAHFLELPETRLNEIIGPIPEYLMKKIAQIFRVWLYAVNTPVNDVETIVSRVEAKKMGRLFEGVEVDLQEWKRELEEEYEIAKEERKKAEEELKQAIEERKALEEEKQQLHEQKQLLYEQLQKEFQEQFQQQAEELQAYKDKFGKLEQ